MVMNIDDWLGSFLTQVSNRLVNEGLLLKGEAEFFAYHRREDLREEFKISGLDHKVKMPRNEFF